MSETNDHDLVFLGFGTNLRPKWCPPPWGWLKWRWLAPRWAVYEKLCGFPSVRPLGCWYAPNLSTEGKISRAAKIANSAHYYETQIFVQKFIFSKTYLKTFLNCCAKVDIIFPKYYSKNWIFRVKNLDFDRKFFNQFLRKNYFFL